MIEEVAPIETIKERKSKGLLISLGLFSAFIFLSIVFSIPLTLLKEDNVIWYLCTTFLAELFIIFIATKTYKPIDGWRKFLFLEKPKLLHLFLGTFVGFLTFIFIQVLNYVFSELFKSETESSNTSNSLNSSDGLSRYIMLFFLVPLLIPFIEELFFRGFLLNTISYGKWTNKKIGTAFAVFFSSFYFAFAHFQGFSSVTDLFVPVAIFIVGFINALLIINTKSIWTAFASHATYNSITVFFMIIASSSN